MRRTAPLFDCTAQRPELTNQIGELMVGVQSAGVWQHPQHAPLDALRLQPETGSRTIEGRAIGSDADYCDPEWGEASHFLLEPVPAGSQLFSGKLCCRHRRPGYQIGNPEFPLQQQVLLPWANEARCKAGQMEGGPESVAWPSKMMAGGSRVQPRIDPAEQHPQVELNEVRDSASCCSRKLGLAGTRIRRDSSGELRGLGRN